MASSPSSVGELLGLVAAMDAALLPCLPARELQAADRSSHPSLRVDVERHSKEFMDAAKKIQLFFIRAGHQNQPSRDYVLRKYRAAKERTAWNNPKELRGLTALWCSLNGITNIWNRISGDIAALEEELKDKDELMQRQLQLVSKWTQLLRSQKAARTDELVKV